MSDDAKPQVLRLRRSHEPDPEGLPDLEIGRRLIGVQSLRAAFTAGLIVIILFSLLWLLLSQIRNEIYPWFALLLGPPMGLAVRRAGLGLDWRFPTLTAVMTLLGCLVGNVVVAAAFTAPELGMSTLDVLFNLTTLTWYSFLVTMLTPADTIFAVFAAAVAAFFSLRRLDRRQYLAVRLYRQSRNT